MAGVNSGGICGIEKEKALERMGSGRVKGTGFVDNRTTPCLKTIYASCTINIAEVFEAITKSFSGNNMISLGCPCIRPQDRLAPSLSPSILQSEAHEKISTESSQTFPTTFMHLFRKEKTTNPSMIP